MWTSLHDKMRDLICQVIEYRTIPFYDILGVFSRYARFDLDAFDKSRGGNNNLVFYAFKANNLSALKLLLDGGADPCVVNGNGQSLLHIIARQDEDDMIDCEEVTELVLNHYVLLDTVRKHKFVNAADNTGITPLIAAASSGNTAVAAWLLSNSARVNAKRPGGWTAAHEAAKRGNKGTLQLLLKNGADPEIKATHFTQVKVIDVVDSSFNDIKDMLLNFSIKE